MSLVINHNMMAMNSTRNLNETYGKLATSTRRLSSGLRVGTAADDAAGLAMRELMRADIATLGQGLRNANDGISMIQTADGALGVIDAKLVRMKELAEQAATGTYSDIQRKLIDQEYQLMADEITRIAQDTDFNSRKLLAGTGMPISVEGSKGIEPPQVSNNLEKLEGTVQTWKVANPNAASTHEISTAAANLTGTTTGNVTTYAEDAASGSITFSETTDTGLVIKNEVTTHGAGTGDSDFTHNSVTGEIDVTTTATVGDRATISSSIDTFSVAKSDVKSFKVFAGGTAIDSDDWGTELPITGTVASTTAGDNVLVVVEYKDGRIASSMIEGGTTVPLSEYGTFDYKFDGTNYTFGSTSTAPRTNGQIKVTSDIKVEKDFEYTSKTGAKVESKISIDKFDKTTFPNSNTYTHNVKNGEIEINKGASIESYASATYGEIDFVPESVKVEVFNAETGEWDNVAFQTDPTSSNKIIELSETTEKFRITADYGHGKVRRDTFSGNTGGAFNVEEKADGTGYVLKARDTDPATTGDQTKASTTQITVKSEDLMMVNVHFGSSNASTDNYDTEIEQATAKSLGVGKLAGDSIDTQENAKKALDNLTEAIRRKDAIRAQIGSTQNRLSATIENVTIQQENLQASESRISDVDVATEMTEFNKNQIMTNAAVSMLAQANSLPKMAQKLLDAR